MKILYIDESSTPELSSQDKYAIVCGVLIEEIDEVGIKFLMNHLKEKYKLSLEKHIHAVEVFEDIKSPSYLGITTKRTISDLRKEFQEDVWAMIKNYNLEYVAINVPKVFVNKSLTLSSRADGGRSWINSKDFHAKVDRQLPMDVAINAIYHWATKKCKTGDGKLKVVFESRSGDLFTVKNHSHISDKEVFKNPHMISFGKHFKESVVSVAFANKEVGATGLEFADIISYTCNSYFLKVKKKTLPIDKALKKAVIFKAIHKTLGSKHYKELSQPQVRKYIPSLLPRIRRIKKHYNTLPSSPSPT